MLAALSPASRGSSKPLRGRAASSAASTHPFGLTGTAWPSRTRSTPTPVTPHHAHALRTSSARANAAAYRRPPWPRAAWARRPSPRPGECTIGTTGPEALNRFPFPHASCTPARASDSDARLRAAPSAEGVTSRGPRHLSYRPQDRLALACDPRYSVVVRPSPAGWIPSSSIPPQGTRKHYPKRARARACEPSRRRAS